VYYHSEYLVDATEWLFEEDLDGEDLKIPVYHTKHGEFD